MMNQHIRTVIRPHHRHSEASQRKGATGAEVYVIGTVTMADFVRQLREGEEAEIEWLFLLAEPKSKACPQPVRDLFRTMGKIEEDHGAIIVEWGSGRRLRSDRKRDRDEMVERAVEMIRHSGRTLAGTAGGRPRDEYTPDQKKKMRPHWVSRENTNNAQRQAAIKEELGFTPGAGKLRQMFGSPLGNRAK